MNNLFNYLSIVNISCRFLILQIPFGMLNYNGNKEYNYTAHNNHYMQTISNRYTIAAPKPHESLSDLEQSTEYPII